MQKRINKAASLLALFCIVACDQQKDSFTDVRDGKKYKTVKIGEQVWMAENLNYNVAGSRCYGDGSPEYSASEVQANCDKYGRLYNWATAMGIDKEFNEKEWNGSDVKRQGVCPKGWHLPSNADWDKLYRFADGTSGTKSPYDSKTAGKHLKAASGWNDYEGKSGNGEDTYGFSALPGGYGYSDGNFLSVGSDGGWWSSIEYGSYYAYCRNMTYYGEYADRYNIYKDFLFSVRCVGD